MSRPVSGIRKTKYMDSKTKIIIFVVVAVVVGIPLLANLGSEKGAKQPAAPDAAKGPAAAKTGTPHPRSLPQQQPQAAPSPGPMGAPPINVANTTWTIRHPVYGYITVQFLANGTLQAQSDKLPTPIQGAWQQNGNNVTISTSMGGMSAQIKGDQLTIQGQAARRLR